MAILLTVLVVWLIGQREGFANADAPALPMKIPVLVVKYFPVKGDRIDLTVTGDWGAPLKETRLKTDKLIKAVIHALQGGSRYHGYKDTKAQPSLIYEVLDQIEFLEPMPTIPRARRRTPLTDYKSIMKRVKIRKWVEERGVKEVWIWGYHGGVLDLWESNMASPYGDISNSNRDPNDLPVLKSTYTVYHYNYQRGASEAVEDHMHQIESVLNFVDGRDRTPPEKWSELLFWGKFVGSDRSHKIVRPGCGWAHYPPNGERDYDWANKRFVETDIEDWKPDGTGKKQRINCDRWGGDSLRWFVYWMQNLPGADNGLSYNGAPLTNWWLFIGDFDRAMQKKMKLVKDSDPQDTTPPISLHPRNGHYFLWRGEPTLLITSGEHYGALLNLDFDYTRYFDTLKADTLNHTRVFSGTYREISGSFGITDNPLAPKPNRYICPWQRSDQPGYFDGGNRFDLTRWDPAYFARLRDLMKAAQRRGIVVEMTLFCPLYKDELWAASPMNRANNVNRIGDCPRTEVYTLKHKRLLDVQVATTRKLVRELNAFDNLYFEVCNEPYFGGVTTEWQHQIVDTIRETEASLPNKHLISINVANGQKKVEDPHPGVSIFNFHYCVPPDTVAMNYQLNRVIGENETGFRGSHDFLYRSEAWDFLLAGGGLYNNLDYSFTPKHPDGTFLEYRSPGGGSPALRGQLRILKEFLYGFDFLRMKPDKSVVKRISPDLSVSALVEPGRACAIYIRVPVPKRPKKITDYLRDNVVATISVGMPRGQYQADWVDTKTGETAKTESFSHAGGRRDLVSPAFANDIALRIVRSSD